MREIKFRTWDQTLNRMLQPITSMHASDGNFQKLGIGDESIVMQFTGLHDKNGREIYEGDIIDIPEYPNHLYRRGVGFSEWKDLKIEGLPKYVVFYNYKFCLFNPRTKEYSDLFNLLSTVSVVGNIYENPELLK